VRSFSIPFRFTGGKVAFTTDPTTEIEQKIVDCLVTSPMERIGVTDYGANLYNLVFENIDDLVEGDLRLDIVSEIESRVSGATVVGVEFKEHAWYDSTVVCRIAYSMPLSPPRVVEVNLSALLTEETPL